MSKRGPDFLTWWQTTHQARSSAEQMWDSWQAPFREHLSVAIYCIGPIQSLYEVGCGAGPNLRLLHQQRPEIRLGGSEPCEGMATFASEQLGVHIDTMALPETPTTYWDAILSCYTMAYLEPEVLRDTLARLYTGGHSYLILMEPMGQGELIGRGERALPEWHHAYLPVLVETGWQLLWRWPILPTVDGLNGLLIAAHKGDA